MKKLFAFIVMAAALASCAREEQPKENTRYTLTVEATLPQGGHSAAVASKALSLDASTSPMQLHATWAAGEKVVVYKYEEVIIPFLPNIPTWTPIGYLTPSVISDGGVNCTLTGELDVNGIQDIEVGETLNLIFGGSKGYGSEPPAYPQDGTLERIQDYYDYAIATVTVESVTTTSGSKRVITADKAVFVNQQSIVRFYLKDAAGNAIIPDELTVSVTGCKESFGLSSPITFTDYASAYVANGNCFFLALTGQGSSDYSGDISIRCLATNGLYYAYEKSGASFSGSTLYPVGVSMKLKTIDLSAIPADRIEGDVFEVQDGDVLTGTLSSGIKIRVNTNGATVTLQNASITASGNWSGIECKNNTTLLLSGSNTVTGGSGDSMFEGRAGIYIASGKTLTIDGSGSLTAKAENGSVYAAGIGAGRTESCGNIVIMGGNITAQGGEGAGIGTGHTAAQNVTCGDISIYGGTVNASSRANGAGIGTGFTQGGYSNTCGDILIAGGNITATGAGGGAGIGSAERGTCGAITISGGTVNATGGNVGAGIGSGHIGSCGNITINGGSVTAKGGSSKCAGIGTAKCASCGTITVTSDVSRVEAIKGGDAFDCIGRGENDMDYGYNVWVNASCGTITIGDTVYWNGSDYQNGGVTYLRTSPLVYEP